MTLRRTCVDKAMSRRISTCAVTTLPTALNSVFLFTTPSRSFLFGGRGRGDDKGNQRGRLAESASKDASFMEKVLEKNVALLKKSIELQNAAYERAVEDARRRGAPPPPKPNVPGFIQQVLQHGEAVQSIMAKSRGVDRDPSSAASTTTERSKPPSQGTVPPSSAQEKHTPLNPHLEELFAELRARRERIEQLKAHVDDLTQRHAIAEELCKELKSTEERLRSQLRAVDVRVVQQADEILSLKEQLKEIKDLKSKVTALEHERAVWKKGQQPGESKDLTIQDLTQRLQVSELELRRQEKRIERFRSQSPGMVALLNTVRTLLGRVPVEGVGTDTPAVQAVERALLDSMKRYTSVLVAAWPETVPVIGARNLLRLAARQALRYTIPHAKYDARVMHKGGSDRAAENIASTMPVHVRALLQDMERFTVTDGGQSGSEVHVVLPMNPGPASETLYPYGTLRVLCEAAKRLDAMHRANGLRSGTPLSTLYTKLAWLNDMVIVPFLSDATIHQEPFSRVSIAYEKTRSSKPGGQAANVTETHVSARLVLDGEVVARAECQDTRSQHENMKIVEQRLLKEKVSKLNQDLAEKASSTACDDMLSSPIESVPEELNWVIHPFTPNTKNTNIESGGGSPQESFTLLDECIFFIIFPPNQRQS